MGLFYFSFSNVTMVFEKVVVIDARDHIMGRLASTIAKELLQGQKVVVTRCEGIVVTGSLLRNKMTFLRYLNKRCNTKPSHGPFHYRAPSRMLYRVIRGMIPHKTARGAAAMARLRVYEGVPTEYNKMKRMVVPHALRVLRHTPGRKYTVLGKLASEVGWKHAETVEAFEAKRKEDGKKYYQAKVAAGKAAANKKASSAVTAELAQFGF